MIDITASINITLCSCGLFFIFLVLISLFFRKQRSSTFRPMIFISLLEIILLISVIAQWYIFMEDISYPDLYRVLIVSVYPVSNLILLGIQWYIIAFFKDTAKLYSPNTIFESDGFLKYGAVIVLLGTIVFISSVWTKWFYYFDSRGEDFYTPLFFVPWLFSIAMCLPNSYLVLKNRRFLGSARTLLLSMYWVLPMALMFIDYLVQLNLSAFSMVAFVFIMSMSLDLRQGEELLEREASLSKLEAELMESRSRLMLSQIQPHFMFNALNVISALCDEDPQLARDATNTFADYLRENVNTIGRSDPVPFFKELEHVKRYVWLEKLRFGERIHVEYEIGPKDFLIPSLTLQPIVENAIKHGVCKREGGGSVLVSTGENDREYIITVSDNGVGFVPEEIANDNRIHVGIVNVTNRISIQMNGDVKIKSVLKEGTTVTITIPKRQDRKG